MGDGGKEDPSLAARNQLANSRVTIISTGNAGAAGFLTSDGPYPGLQLKPIDEHPDAGKTTLTEKLLLFGGAIQLAGEAKARGARARNGWRSSASTGSPLRLLSCLRDGRGADGHGIILERLRLRVDPPDAGGLLQPKSDFAADSLQIAQPVNL